MAIADTQRTFDSEETRKGYETAEAALRMASGLTAEGPNLRTRRITFAPEHRAHGLTAVLVVGTVIFTGTGGAVMVPERSIKVLRKLHIPFEIAAG